RRHGLWFQGPQGRDEGRRPLRGEPRRDPRRARPRRGDRPGEESADGRAERRAAGRDRHDPEGETHFMIRTHDAGSLRREHAGQVVVREEGHAHDLRAEYGVKVVGEVRVRPAGNENPDLPTGEVEVVASEVEVLSESAPLPFPIEGKVDVSEEVRLKYRYLDLRRQQVAEALKIRSRATYLAHEVMREHGFVYVETPSLTRSTPEGARDFLVPVRLQPGNWYALPQSPQLFKQLLMVSGLERYYQLARCFRDEGLRADRQPEFTQIDIEMSFVDQDDVIELGEALIGRIWKEILGYELPTPLPRISYAEAMARYGSDKPDLRFGVELIDLTDYFANTSFRVFQQEYVGAIVMPGGASQTRRELDGWQEWARSRGARGLAYVLVQEDGLGGPVAKNLSETEVAGLTKVTGAQPGDAIFFAAGLPGPSRELL